MKSIRGKSAIITPTGHPNQIDQATGRQPLLPVSQSLQIIQKKMLKSVLYGSQTAKRRQLKTIGAFFLYNLLIFISLRTGLLSSPSPDSSGNPFVPVPRLREAQKIATYSGKSS